MREGRRIPCSEAGSPASCRLSSPRSPEPPDLVSDGVRPSPPTPVCVAETRPPPPPPQGLRHLQQQDPPQQLHRPHRDGAAAAGRGAGPDGGAVPGAQGQARPLPAAAHIREGRHRRECPRRACLAASGPPVASAARLSSCILSLSLGVRRRREEGTCFCLSSSLGWGGG